MALSMGAPANVTACVAEKRAAKGRQPSLAIAPIVPGKPFVRVAAAFCKGNSSIDEDPHSSLDAITPIKLNPVCCPFASDLNPAEPPLAAIGSKNKSQVGKYAWEGGSGPLTSPLR